MFCSPFLRAICCGILLALVLSQIIYLDASAAIYTNTASHTPHASQQALAAPPPPSDIQLDSRLPLQTVSANSGFTNVNTKFGSRFDFNIAPSASSVYSGTDGIFHDNMASYTVGIAPTGQHKTFVFHMGGLDNGQGDAYVANEHWVQGLSTTRWAGDAADNEGMHIVVDFIDTFHGEPGCTAIASCANAVKDDTVPVFIVGVTLQNSSANTLSGKFLFGSNRALSANNGCVAHTTPGGTALNVLSYDPSADVTGGTLFLGGDTGHWSCNTGVSSRVGLGWSYSVASGNTSSAYLILGGWNPSTHLFSNSSLPSGCQNEGLYASSEWPSQDAVVDFAMDNLFAHDHLLAQAQVMENYLIGNNSLTPGQRWIIGDTLRSYKASTWLVARQSCAGGGYDAAVYEGSYGLLSTVDVMHEYGYFEITRVPWFFKAAMDVVFKHATSNSFGTYFQHDQGGDLDGNGACTAPGRGRPTLGTSCYGPPLVTTGNPMPTEENDDVALLVGYYESVTGDAGFLKGTIGQIDASMSHNIKVGDPKTGIAYNFQDTNTTYDAASDCLHNNAPRAGNLYYQGLKEATGYRAAAYLDGLVSGNNNGATWTNAASKIEAAMVQKYNSQGFIPVADSTAFSNCNGRTVTLGEGLFYLHLIGQDNTMNQTLLADMAQQYPGDLQADTVSSPSMIAMTSTTVTGSQCSTDHCVRYEWFSKVMLSGIVADLVYTKYKCSACGRLDLAQAPYNYNFSFRADFGDGFHENGTDWGGHFYPRGVISWAYLSSSY